MRSAMKTPIPYYGGKQRMAQHILPNIPEHDSYTESFFGGGAIYFAKEKSKLETINDINGELINFYRVLQTRFPELKKMIMTTLHSRKMHKHAQVIYENPELFDDVQRAWALWVLANQSFSSMLNGSWGYDRSNNSMSKKLGNAKLRFTDELRERIENTTIECTDAIRVIKSRDRKGTHHLIEPEENRSDHR
jgi:DNA adenine methylase